MEKFKSLVIFLLCLTTIVACRSNRNNQNNDETQSASNIEAQLNWVGYYYGELPCASCPAIKTSITLSEDGTFERTTEYVGEKDGFYISKGEIKWSDDKSKIKIDDNEYLVEDSSLTMLGSDGNKIKGELADKYILKKSKLAEEPDVDEYITVVDYLGDDKKEYQIVFNTDGEKPIATVQVLAEKFHETLTQTTSWAKGAIYKNKDITLEARNTDATLTIGKKKILLKEKK